MDYKDCPRLIRLRNVIDRPIFGAWESNWLININFVSFWHCYFIHILWLPVLNLIRTLCGIKKYRKCSKAYHWYNISLEPKYVTSKGVSRNSSRKNGTGCKVSGKKEYLISRLIYVDEKWASPMLATDVGDELCWWHVWVPSFWSTTSSYNSSCNCFCFNDRNTTTRVINIKLYFLNIIFASTQCENCLDRTKS